MKTKLALILLMVSVAAGCNGDVLGAGTPSNPATESFHPSLGVDIASFSRTESGVYYRDVRVGTGDQVALEDQVTMTFAGYLKDATLFSSQSTPTQQSIARIPIVGLRDGIIGMRAGGRRTIVIPSALGFSWEGAQFGSVRVPRNATLVYDVEVFTVTKPTPTTQ